MRQCVTVRKWYGHLVYCLRSTSLCGSCTESHIKSNFNARISPELSRASIIRFVCLFLNFRIPNRLNRRRLFMILGDPLSSIQHPDSFENVHQIVFCLFCFFYLSTATISFQNMSYADSQERWTLCPEPWSFEPIDAFANISRFS